MSVIITDSCVACGACIWECPEQAIIPGMTHPSVDGDACTECLGWYGESQCMVVCPASALTVRPESREQLLTKFRDLHPQRAVQDLEIWRRIGGS
jgi:ferredoxin